VAWVYLIIAGLLEVVWAYFMKQSAGFTRLWPSVITLGTMGVSFALLSLAMKTLPLGTAYTVWTGIGAVGAFVVGVIWLNEGVHPMRVAAAGLILTGLVLMRLAPSGGGAA
jgi:quaternary ammonium compound-resistance protein SugE